MRNLLIAALICASSVSGLSAQNNSAAARVAAGITLGQDGISREDAGAIVTAIEMISAHSKRGPVVTKLLDQFEAEARFAMRGDPILRDRLDALGDPTPELSVTIAPLSETLSVPPNEGLTSLALPGGSSIKAVTLAGTPVCAPHILDWSCDPLRAQGELALDIHASAGGFLVYATKPIAP